MFKNALSVVGLAVAEFNLVPIGKLHLKRLALLLTVAFLFPVLLLSRCFGFWLRRSLGAIKGWELRFVICIG